MSETRKAYRSDEIPFAALKQITSHLEESILELDFAESMGDDAYDSLGAENDGFYDEELVDELRAAFKEVHELSSTLTNRLRNYV